MNNKGYTTVAFPISVKSKDSLLNMYKLDGNKFVRTWGTSTNEFIVDDKGNKKKGSKFYDNIHWSKCSNWFQLACNTNEIQY